MDALQIIELIKKHKADVQDRAGFASVSGDSACLSSMVAEYDRLLSEIDEGSA